MGGTDSSTRSELEVEIARLRGEAAELRRALDAERAIRHAVVDNAPDFIVHCDLDGKILFVNRVAAGFTREQVVGAAVTNFAPPEYGETIRACIARAATGEGAEFESKAVGANGTLTHFHNRVAPVKEGDRVVSIVLFTSDVGRLKTAELELEAREAHLRIVLEAARMGVAELDVTSGAMEVDARCREIWGLAEGEPFDIGRALARVVPEDLERVKSTLETIGVTGEYRMLEFRIRRPSGAVRWVQGAGRLLVKGSAQLIVGGFVDVDDRKRLEIQLLQAQKLESIGRLAGGVAHDFNNLLTAVMGSVALAEQALPLDSPARGELSEIRLGAERGASLTSQLLAFARRQFIQPRVMSLSGLVADVERLLRRVIGEDIDLAIMCQATGHVRVDPHQIERVLINLASNARDAMRSGGRLTIETVDVTLDESYALTRAEVIPGPYVMLAVSDTGHGMTAEELSHVFEPFYTTKGFDQGTGLGLATVYGIVRQAGGFIQAYSEVGHGTTFRVYLPRVEREVDALVPPQTPVAERGAETILLVEDEPTIRRIVVRTLKGYGYTVLEASRADEALEVAKAHAGRIDVLVTDVVMPGMGGRQLAERLHESRPETAVLYISGYTENAIVHHGVLDDGVEFLQKPFGPADLHARLRRMLDAKKR